MIRADEVHRLRADLYFWQAHEPAVKTDLSCCAHQTDAGFVFIDPIPLTKSAESELLEVASIAAIVLTSGNHARAAADFRTRFAIPIYAHGDAVAELGINVDHTLTDGDEILDRFQVISLPGAAPGEIALSRSGVLHVGDALIHLPSHGFAILPDKYCGDAHELRRSLGKLLRFPFELLTFAHGLPIVVNARQRLSQLLA